MIHWKPRQLDRYSVSIAFLILAGLLVTMALTGVEGLQPAEVLRVLSMWGFAEELIFTSVGIIVLAFFAGRGKNRAVAVGGVVLLLLANSTMVGPANLLTTYPTDLGTDRATLLELADQNPNKNIAGEIPVLLRLGETIGTGRLTMPWSRLGDRLRALTDIDVVSADGPYEFLSAGFAGGETQEVGMLGTIPVSVVGDGDDYLWVEGPDNIYVVARDLLTAEKS